MLPVIEARLGPLSRGGPTIPPVSLAAPDPARLAAIRDRGVDVRPIADGSPFLRGARHADASRRRRRTRRQPRAARAARPVADAGGHGDHRRRLPRHREDAEPDAPRRQPHGDDRRGLLALAPLAQLETLNLYGTRITDAGLAPLAALPRLRRVYLWQTAVTPAGVERLRASRPKLEIVLGDDEAPDRTRRPDRGRRSRGRERGGRRAAALSAAT